MLVTGGGEEAEQIRASPCTRRAMAAPWLSSPSLDASDVPAPLQHCARAVQRFLSMEAVGGNDQRGELDIEMSTLQDTAPVVTSGPAVAFLTGRWSREVHLGGLFEVRAFQESRFCGSPVQDMRSCHRISHSRLLIHRGLLGKPSLLGKYSPMSTLPISTKSRSTTDPNRYPKAGPNTAMAKRMATYSGELFASAKSST